MIRGINRWLWPYMAVVMYNGKKKVCIARSTGIGTWSLRQLVYLVTLSRPDGEMDSKNKSLWVTGSVMGNLITASGRAKKIKIPKYAYNYTSKDPTSVRWMGVLSQLSQEQTV